MDHPAPPPQLLDYANAPRLAWVGRHRKKLIALAILLAIVGPLVWYRGPLWDRAQWVYWMRQAAAHRMSDDLPLIVNDPAEIAKFSGHPDYIPMASRGGDPNALYYLPRAVREMIRLDPRFQVLADGPILFLGTLHRPDGQPRLVVIRANVMALSAQGRPLLAWGGRHLLVVTAIPSAFDGPPTAAQNPLAAPSTFYLESSAKPGTGKLTNVSFPTRPHQLLHARIDSADSSHLVITHFLEKRIIHILLQNDDTIRQETELIQVPLPQPNDPANF